MGDGEGKSAGYILCEKARGALDRERCAGEWGAVCRGGRCSGTGSERHQGFYFYSARVAHGGVCTEDRADFRFGRGPSGCCVERLLKGGGEGRSRETG